ncbi:hypothetical protein FE243_08695 [Aliarcobacter thereius]|uniref:P-loop NTPase fold protein n=1 Tax=Aliarcobacter thereius TaxID=544718 RepID=UPI0010FD13E7|nr:P-loop NTPase fold protein [Aliarcobacter thereius]TLT06213.1 hypothetical protein FE243_08695 [Aliarcobacter thereius]
MSFENSMKILENLQKKISEEDLNEADTRFHIIDEIIKNILFWPQANIKLEKHTNEGYIDYILNNDNGKTFLVVEAKKISIKFAFSTFKEITNNKIKVKILMKDENTKIAIEQVKRYCNDIGCNVACITNGEEWAFFRTFIDGKQWQDGNAYILTSIDDFISEFNFINQNLTYKKVVNDFSFKKLFESTQCTSVERYKPKDTISGYKEQIQNNKIENLIGGYFEKFFGAIKEHDTELLKECYVNERGFKINFDKVTNLLEDALSPFMKDNLHLKNIDISGNSDSFSDNIIELIKKEKKEKVIVLFGGKGSGKTTFLVNLFNSDRNKKIKENSVICYINLLDIANDKESIKSEIIDKLLEKLDVDNLLKQDNEILIKLFEDRYNIALKQELDGLDINGETFNLKRNDLLKEYRKDYMYCLERLSKYLKNSRKAIIINIDNTDQFNQELQDYCFSFANELSKKLYCISIISLREEKYSTSNIKGYLDAYEQNGFHISSPNPKDVFIKRINFIENKIKSDRKIDLKKFKKIEILFSILKANLNNENSEFNKFLTAATHGNIRHGLELFKSFLFSRYTNIDEMIIQQNWTIVLHQIIKPIMIPTYRYYSEDTPPFSIPNIYKLRSEHNSSHFTAYRILKKLSVNSEAYKSIYELEDFFHTTFDMKEDFRENINILLERGLVESENGYTKYSEDIQSIKITSFGYYMHTTIFKDFTYLELISCDISVTDLNTSNNIVSLSNQEYKLLKSNQYNTDTDEESNTIRFDRLQIRLNKVRKLCEYFKKEEQKELSFYEINDNSISNFLIQSFNEQEERIQRSAKRNLNINCRTKNGIQKLD